MRIGLLNREDGTLEVRELASAMRGAEEPARGVRAAQLYPAATGGGDGALVALDVWELQPGASLSAQAHPEEQLVYVLSGEGRLSGEGGSEVSVRADTCVHIDAGERVSLRNAGREVLRVLVTTPLLVRSSRAAGIAAGGRLAGADGSRDARPIPSPEPEARASTAPSARAENRVAEQPAPVSAPAEEEEAPPNIEGIMRRASELRGQPRPERRRQPEPDPEPQAPEPEAQAAEEDEEEEASSLMELMVAFDAGTRGDGAGTGEGYGRYLVQAPGRRPAVRRVELGDDFTPLQAEYRVLIECLSYVAERLTATGRSPEGVQLDIRSSSEQVVNQLLGTMKIREANIKRDHAEASSLLDQFADWRIEWAGADELVRLFGG
jgi:quercetin dioxygenase-like cupin family protein/ribonuclease HI